jgi:hypothetical protein
LYRKLQRSAYKWVLYAWWKRCLPKKPKATP